MIRWRFVVTRLLVITAVLLLLSFGMGYVASYVTTMGLQKATAEQVDSVMADGWFQS